MAGLRVVFVGMNDSIPARHIEALSARYSVVAVFECVFRRGWRQVFMNLSGLRPAYLKRFASRHDIPHAFITREQRGAMAGLIAAYSPDVVCIVSMPYLMPVDVLSSVRLGVVNLHPSLLPAYRGVNPLFWQIYEGVKEGGVTVHCIDEKADHGPILVQRKFPLADGITYAALQDLIGEHGPVALVEAVELLASNGANDFPPQPNRSPTRRARGVSRDEAEELVRWREWGIEEAWRVLRGIGPGLAPPFPRWRDLGWYPRVEGYEKSPMPEPVGGLRRDAKGWYLRHPEGRLRLGFVFTPLDWLKHLLELGMPGLRKRLHGKQAA